MMKLNLRYISIGERRVVYEDDQYRVVAEGILGYKVQLIFEIAHIDAMHVRSWHVISRHTSRAGVRLSESVSFDSSEPTLDILARLLEQVPRVEPVEQVEQVEDGFNV